MCQEGVDRLKEIRSEANGGGDALSKKQMQQHRVKEPVIYHSKAKDGNVKLFRPKNTPTADTLEGTRGERERARATTARTARARRRATSRSQQGKYG